MHLLEQTLNRNVMISNLKYLNYNSNYFKWFAIILFREAALSTSQILIHAFNGLQHNQLIYHEEKIYGIKEKVKKNYCLYIHD